MHNEAIDPFSPPAQSLEPNPGAANDIGPLLDFALQRDNRLLVRAAYDFGAFPCASRPFTSGVCKVFMSSRLRLVTIRHS
jgi:hypothetical protein